MFFLISIMKTKNVTHYFKMQYYSLHKIPPHNKYIYYIVCYSNYILKNDHLKIFIMHTFRFLIKMK